MFLYINTYNIVSKLVIQNLEITYIRSKTPLIPLEKNMNYFVDAGWFSNIGRVENCTSDS